MAVLPARPLQAQCTDMSNSVSATVVAQGDRVTATFTNNSGQNLYVWYTFAKDGAPSRLLSNASSGVMYANDPNGPLSSVHTYNADTNPPTVYWYAVSLAQKNGTGCNNPYW